MLSDCVFLARGGNGSQRDCDVCGGLNHAEANLCDIKYIRRLWWLNRARSGGTMLRSFWCLTFFHAKVRERNHNT